MTYSEKLKDPRWQKKRLEVLERDNWHCQICLDTEETLNVHHKKYIGDPWDAPDEDLQTLCETCHKNIKWLSTHNNYFINKSATLSQYILHNKKGVAFYTLEGHFLLFISSMRIKVMHHLTDPEYAREQEKNNISLI